MANIANNQVITLNKTQKYLVSIFDGAFSEQQLENKRNLCFYRVANFQSPKTGKKVGEVLNEDAIGVILNELDNLQFNRKLASKVARAGEAQF